MRKKKTESSKKFVGILITLFVAVIVYSMALMWETKDTSGLSYLIPSVGGLVATAVGFYFWKAKAENLVKIRKSMIKMEMETEKIDDEIERLANEDFFNKGE